MSSSDSDEYVTALRGDSLVFDYEHFGSVGPSHGAGGISKEYPSYTEVIKLKPPIDKPLDDVHVRELNAKGIEFEPNIIGSGTYGSVWKCKWDTTDADGRRVMIDLACKRISLADSVQSPTSDIDWAVASMAKEVEVHQMVDHPNCVATRYIFHAYEPQYAKPISILIFMEICNGSLRNILQSQSNLIIDEEHTGRWFIQIAKGLQYLHSGTKLWHGIEERSIHVAHLDIKPSNILFVRKPNRQFQFKLADFGISYIFESTAPPGETPEGYRDWKMEGRFGTIAFMAPEVKNYHRFSGGYDPRLADVFSLGVTLVTSIVGPNHRKRFTNDAKSLTLNQMIYNWKHDMSNQLIYLLYEMLRKEPQRRMTLDHVLQHQWTKSFEKHAVSCEWKYRI